jgi:hypothetical protein
MTNGLTISRWIYYKSLGLSPCQRRHRSSSIHSFLTLPTNYNPFTRFLQPTNHSLIPFARRSIGLCTTQLAPFDYRQRLRQSRRIDLHSLTNNNTSTPTWLFVQFNASTRLMGTVSRSSSKATMRVSMLALQQSERALVKSTR